MSLETIASAACIAVCLGAYALATQGVDLAVKMTSLQHPNGNGTYRAGMDDIYSVAFLVLALTGLRKLVMVCIASPLAAILQVAEPKNIIKFKQASWVFVYYAVAFAWGFYEFYNSAYWLDVKAMYEGYPQTAKMSGSYKMYFLFQMSFWFHMVFVTLVEPHQKDFIQMMMHHFITITMLCGCYGCAVTRFGHAVLVEQDFADVFLPLAKMVNYAALGKSRLKNVYQKVADGLFALFALAWIPTRHIILPFYLYWALFDGTADITPNGCDCGQGTACIWAPERLCILTTENWWKAVLFYKVALGFFQILLFVWLRSLLIAVYKALSGGSIKGIEESSCQELKQD